MNRRKFFWLNGIFDQETLKSFPSTSPAATFFQRGFVESIKKMNNDVEIFGYPVERTWPFGRLWVSSETSNLSPGLKGTLVSYLNISFIRSFFQYIQLSKSVKHSLRNTKNYPDYLVTYSCQNRSSYISSETRVAKKIRKEKGIPWIVFVADGEAPNDADGYIYQNWSYYQSKRLLAPSIFIDGGIPTLKSYSDTRKTKPLKVLLYMGALTEHGGVSKLARAFHSLPHKDMQLWVCGRGVNSELDNLAIVDKRIKLFGFVSEAKLDRLASSVMAFANPRCTTFKANKLNYPSKLLHYLAYQKPIISTWTEGLSPEYNEVLLPIQKDTEAGIARAIQNALSMNEKEYVRLCKRIAKFNKTHSWNYQVSRLLNWLQDEI